MSKKIIYSTKEWKLTGAGAALASCTVIINSLGIETVAATKELKGSDGKLKQNYIYDTQRKYTMQVMLEFPEGNEAGLCHSTVLQDVFLETWTLQNNANNPAIVEFEEIKPDPDSKVDYSNEDFCQLSLNFTVKDDGMPLFADRTNLV